MTSPDRTHPLTAPRPPDASPPDGEHQRGGLARTQGRDTRQLVLDHTTGDLDATADHTALAALRSRLHTLAPRQPPWPSPTHRALLTTDPTGPTP
ncbi:hypothetical protein [Kitasatospora griseola]|uniref:hypothetical protein n=1 Tax=Kitasatospora griseola TaxID=2064 RepID=UPI000AAE3BE8|nr:hypothetical protein [Kitasatospora griseola]